MRRKSERAIRGACAAGRSANGRAPFRPAPTATVGLICAILALCTAPGCVSGEFTRPQYDTVYIGQPPRGVERALGEPTRVEEDTWVYVNESPYYRAEIVFDKGLVSRKTFSYTRPPDSHGR